MAERARGIVRKIWDETPHLKGIVLEVPEDVATRHERPGQVIVLYPNDEDKVFVVVASAPGDVGFELLLGPAAQAKLGLEVGKVVELDPPTGTGFRLEIAAERDVLLFAVGSALAAIRPVIEIIRRNRKRHGRVVLYAGAHTEADFPYQAEYEAWKGDGIDIVIAISKPWVQDLFLESPVPLDNAVAFVCGMNAMMDGVTATLVRSGLPEDRIGRNW